SKHAWQTAGLEELLSSRIHRFNTPKDIILDVFLTADKNMVGQFAMLVWIPWNNRNNFVWNQFEGNGPAARCQSAAVME
ncbi:hypothetical protein L195_g058711, partial [Trifolium pratense]